MPEIWLNYGITDVVLDIRAENLEQKIDSEGENFGRFSRLMKNSIHLIYQNQWNL